MQQGLSAQCVARLKGGGRVRFDSGEPVIGLRALTPQVGRLTHHKRCRLCSRIECQRVIEHSRDGIEFCPDKTLQPREDRHIDTGSRHPNGPWQASV